MSHMSEKIWFDSQENADFQNAFERAKKILGK